MLSAAVEGPWSLTSVQGAQRNISSVRCDEAWGCKQKFFQQRGNSNRGRIKFVSTARMGQSNADTLEMKGTNV